MMRHLPLVLVSVLAVACSEEDRRNVPAEPTTPPALANATQSDLANELDAAARRGTWGELKRKWQGQTLRWNLTRHRVLCPSETRCNLTPFPVQQAAKHGWLPEVKFAAGEFAKVEALCGASETCDLAIEGTLERLEASDEMPTNLTFKNVRVVTQTARR